MVQIIATVWGWLERLGGIGLILLGVVDNSPIPVPGGMDALTVVLSAHQKQWWWYYAIMATVGGVLGGYMTFSVARKGGKEGLEKKLKKKTAWARKDFEKYGFWSLFVPALLPPPVPYSPFLIVAGGLDYSPRKFLIAVTTARTIRYFALAYLGSIYSRQIFDFFENYYKPVLWTLLALALAGGIAAGIYIWKRKKEGKPVLPESGEQHVKAA